MLPATYKSLFPLSNEPSNSSSIMERIITIIVLFLAVMITAFSIGYNLISINHDEIHK